MSKIEDVLYADLEEAVELRYGSADDPAGPLVFPLYEQGPGAFAEAVIRARQRSDRIEEILLKAKRVKSRLAAKLRDAADQKQDKIDQALVEGQRTRADFSTGDERRAEANLKSFDELRAERLAQRDLAVAEEVVDALTTLHWGLNGWRSDARDILRSYQLESNLER